MKTLLRNYLLNLATLYGVSFVLPGLLITGGFKTLVLGALGLMVINLLVIPLLKIMFLPLNVLTLGIFTWVINVVALYLLTTLIPQIKLVPFTFSGYNLNGFIIPSHDLNVLQVAIVSSFLIGLVSHFLHWLSK
jgi:putative membrane protein